MRRHGLLQQPMPLPSLFHMRPTSSQLSGIRKHATRSARVRRCTCRSEYRTHGAIGDQLHPSTAALRHLCHCCLIPRGRVQETTLEVRTCQLRHRTERHKLLWPMIEPPREQPHQDETVRNREHVEGTVWGREPGRLPHRVGHRAAKRSTPCVGAIPPEQEAPQMRQHGEILCGRDRRGGCERIPAVVERLDQQRLTPPEAGWSIVLANTGAGARRASNRQR